MGQKVHPLGFRLGITKTWDSKWYAEPRQYAALFHEDLEIRRFVKREFGGAGVSKVEIERAGDEARVVIHTARPGLVIGRKGEKVERLKKDLQALTKKNMYIDIQEVKPAELDAQLVAESIAGQLERRVAFRRAMKKAIASARRLGAKGVRVAVGGRLGGAEMARREQYLEGQVPLHTLRADINFGFSVARTTYGAIGVKCWIYRGTIAGTEALPPEREILGAWREPVPRPRGEKVTEGVRVRKRTRGSGGAETPGRRDSHGARPARRSGSDQDD
ncbi:MAG: 30S ribosomal protein S3 [Candidatus Schekmanbacteria bacterium]|nr:30S ribosomal protein S3 [Candidatus Schekmanbacteria bacterium]